MPKGMHQQQDEPEKPDDSSSPPDLSKMNTWFLAPTRPLTEERRRQIAEHEKAVEEGYRLIDSIQHAIDTLARRIEATTNPQLHAALEQNREDLRRYQAELDAEGAQHDEALKWLRPYVIIGHPIITYGRR